MVRYFLFFNSYAFNNFTDCRNSQFAIIIRCRKNNYLNVTKNSVSPTVRECLTYFNGFVIDHD